MKYAVVIVTKPSGHIATIQGPWPGFLNEVQGLNTASEKSIRASETCWVIALESDTPMFAAVVHAANSFGLPHRVLYFPDTPTEYAYTGQ